MGNPPPWACDFLRRSFLMKPRQAMSRPKRIYISRMDAGWRQVSNELEIERALKQRGFERVVLGALPVVEQAALFQEAEVIVGAHGGGLTNLVFCEPGTKVLEFFPARAVNVCYWALANIRSLEYSFVVEPPSAQASCDWGAAVSCPPEIIQSGLDRLGV